MPYKKITDAPENLKKLDGVALTLEQINYIANSYDGLKSEEEKGEIDSAMAVAIGQFKKSYIKKDDSWVKRQKESEENNTEENNIEESKKELKGAKFSESCFRILESKNEEGSEWDVALIVEGKSQNLGTNGLPRYYPADVLQKAATLFDNANVNAYKFEGTVDDLFDHELFSTRAQQPNGLAGNVVGTVDNVHYGDFTDHNGERKEGILGKFHVLEGAKWLRDNLLDLWQRGKQMLGFSIDAEGSEAPGVIGGEPVDLVQSIDRVLEHTLVSRPAAGGQVLRLVASQTFSDKGENEMELSKIIDLIKSHAPALLENKDTEKMKEDELLVLLDEALKIKETKEPGKMEGKKEPEVKKELDVEELPKEDNKKIEQLEESVKVMQLNQKLETSLRESNIPEKAKTNLHNRYFGKIWTEDQLKGDIKFAQDTVAEFKESIPNVGNQGRIEFGSERYDKVQLAMNGFFDGTDQKDKDGKLVPRFNSIKEAYATVVNDPRAYWADPSIILADSYTYMPDMKSDKFTESYNVDRRRALRESVIGSTSSTWDSVFANALHRTLIKEYGNEQLQSFKQIVSSTVPLNDFKEQKRLAIGGYGILPTVAEQGTYQSLTTPADTQYVYSPAKKGGLEDLTIEAVANDDVGAIRNIPIKLGRAAAQTIYRDIWNMLLSNLQADGSTAIASASSPIANQGSTALSTAAWSEAVYTMRKLAHYGDTYEVLGLINKPKFLIVPSELEDVARRVATSDVAVSNIYSAGTSHYNTQSEKNIWQNQMEVIVVDYWGATDTNNWWAIADPKNAPTVEIGYYQGREEPELFVQDQPNVGSTFTADKITYKIRFIYGYNILEIRSFFQASVT